MIQWYIYIYIYIGSSMSRGGRFTGGPGLGAPLLCCDAEDAPYYNVTIETRILLIIQMYIYIYIYIHTYIHTYIYIYMCINAPRMRHIILLLWLKNMIMKYENELWLIRIVVIIIISIVLLSSLLSLLWWCDVEDAARKQMYPFHYFVFSGSEL